MSTTNGVNGHRKLHKIAYETGPGSFVLGKAEDILASPIGADLKKKVELVFTSPPFPLNT
jgi:hypothetical protein